MHEALTSPGVSVPPQLQAGLVRVPPTHRRPKAARWDLLLVCVAAYLATAVGRVHQLFPVLLVLKPALVTALLTMALYLLQQSGPRRISRLRSTTTTCLFALLAWAGLAVPTALHQGVAFQAWTDLARTVAMCLIVAG